ncbi:hypothetical protein [Segetibacter aerophilus]|uniref:Lipocalin-like domain-containing protein n=1 Tax=Segetibacter aerophilus TaxID=670293 RepID=A0A512BBG9_9BACT|nr:hypothetical protein [Segetibacter aerophilus]GEO09312.1 hypothetical protein SAE01_18080 [Segetibacter aerophilus]
MMTIKIFLAIVLTCILVMKAHPQNTTGTTSAITAGVFVGSTPCDSFIKASLEIPSVETCEFIKWEIRLLDNPSGHFQLSALYGESQPNTNGFKGGGKKIEISGTYKIVGETKPNEKHRLYHFSGNHLKPELLLIQMDNNVLHFADNNHDFITGNAGFSYAVNRIEK